MYEATFIIRVRAVFSRIRCKLRNCVTLNFEFTQKVVSACFFLRLVCPAIMTPYLFQLLPEYSDNSNINRSFTLVAKCVQNIANFAGIDDTKENYMQSMALHCRDYYSQMSEFINSISNLNDPDFTSNVVDYMGFGSRFAIDSARLCYYMDFYLNEISTKYTKLQEEVKEIIGRIKETEINLTEGKDTINKMRENYEFLDLGKTVVSTIESSGYFSTTEPQIGTVNSNLNHSPSHSLCINNIKSSTQYSNKQNLLMPITCQSVSDYNCNEVASSEMDDDSISLRKIVTLEKKRVQLLKQLVENMEFKDTAESEIIDLNPKNLSDNIEKISKSKSNILRYIDFVNNNLNSFHLSENVDSVDSLLKQFITINAKLQLILINK